ncbi:MAG: MerR family transcriptional regulator [Spirochaetia bacterium]
MGKYHIGEVCRLLKIRPHVLRYWEQEIPVLAPPKDTSGRRLYSDIDVQKLLRIKYLLYTKRFTIEGAQKQFWEDVQSVPEAQKAQMQELRSHMLALVRITNKWEDRLREAGFCGFREARFPDIEKTIEHIPPELQANLLTDAARFTSEILEKTRLYFHKPEQPAILRPVSGSLKQDQSSLQGLRAFGKSIMRSANTAAVTCAIEDGDYNQWHGPLCTFPITPIRGASVLQLTAESLRAFALDTGTAPYWIILCGDHNADQIAGYLQKHEYFFYPKDKIIIKTIPLLPGLIRPGKVILDTEARVMRSAAGDGVIAEYFSSSEGKELADRLSVTYLFVVSAKNAVINPVEHALLGLHVRKKAGITALMAESGDSVPYQYTGSYVLSLSALSGSKELPFRRVVRSRKCLTFEEDSSDIIEEQVYMLGKFLFDLVEKKQAPAFMLCGRNEWAPVLRKNNPLGKEECQEMFVEQCASWLAGSGIQIPRNDYGESFVAVEISPLFAENAEVFHLRVKENIDEDRRLYS